MSQVKTSPKWSFRGKPKSEISVETPGPGEYNTPEVESVKFNTSQRFGFGTSPREVVRPATAPGPGEYSPLHPKHKQGVQYGFGTSIRQGLKPAAQTNPGPGAYSHPPKMGNGGPKYSAMSKRGGYKSTEVPGPGAYHQAPPVAADLNASALLQHRPRSPKYGFGTASREGVISNAVPGPGSYDNSAHPLKAGSPKYSMRPRTEQRRSNETPGPGAYTGCLTQFGY